METHSNERVEGPIDYPITDEEFEAAINKLKANKSPVIDNILKEVIRIRKEAINPFAPGDFAEKRVLKLVEWFSGHCRAIKS